MENRDWRRIGRFFAGVLGWKRVRSTLIGSLVLLLSYSLYQTADYVLDAKKQRQVAEAARIVYYGEHADHSSQQPLFASEAGAVGNHAAASAVHAPTREEVLAADNRPIDARFLALLAQNEDTVGWVRIEGTAIDYPVVQAEDNAFYLTRDFHKQASHGGSIFLDYRVPAGEPARHRILYGHQMKNGTMFADLLHYESRSYWRDHPVIQYDTPEGAGRWEIFSVYFTDVRHDYIRTEFADSGDWHGFITDLQRRSLHSTGIVLTEDDVVLTLSTCAGPADNTDERFAVHARLIR